MFCSHRSNVIKIMVNLGFRIYVGESKEKKEKEKIEKVVSNLKMRRNTKIPHYMFRSLQKTEGKGKKEKQAA